MCGHTVENEQVFVIICAIGRYIIIMHDNLRSRLAIIIQKWYLTVLSVCLLTALIGLVLCAEN